MTINLYSETDPHFLSECALAEAQAILCRAMRMNPAAEKLLEAELIGTSYGGIEDLLHSESAMTVKDLGRFLAVCGYRLQFDTVECHVEAAVSEPTRLVARRGRVSEWPIEGDIPLAA